MDGLAGRVQRCAGHRPEDLGPTLMHEHVVTDFTPPAQRGRKEVELTFETLYDSARHWADTPGVRRLTITRSRFERCGG